MVEAETICDQTNYTELRWGVVEEFEGGIEWNEWNNMIG